MDQTWTRLGLSILWLTVTPHWALGMGLMGLLQAKRGVPFRPVDQGWVWQQMNPQAPSPTSYEGARRRQYGQGLAGLIRRQESMANRVFQKGTKGQTK